MKKQIECNWMGNMAFEAVADCHKIIMDADPSAGGNDSGPKPKSLLLVAQAGCTGMDVISILRKMKAEPDALRIIVEGDLAEDHPRYFKTVHVKYLFSGSNLEYAKLEKAVALSMDKYCGVSAQLKMGIPVTYEIIME